eukprot:2884707-Rhodomonas_salina.1
MHLSARESSNKKLTRYFFRSRNGNKRSIISRSCTVSHFWRSRNPRTLEWHSPIMTHVHTAMYIPDNCFAANLGRGGVQQRRCAGNCAAEGTEMCCGAPRSSQSTPTSSHSATSFCARFAPSPPLSPALSAAPAALPSPATRFLLRSSRPCNLLRVCDLCGRRMGQQHSEDCTWFSTGPSTSSARYSARELSALPSSSHPFLLRSPHIPLFTKCNPLCSL